ncbi:MAG: sugar ABC transporter permease [Chloroflexi bacterium]|nr:sugar ABC transporter permease [Chloroflexota bacterium]
MHRSISLAKNNNRRKTRSNRINQGYLFIAPTVILILFLTIYPTFKIFDMSMHRLNRRTQEITFVGIDNFVETFKDPHFHTAFKQTLIFTFFGVIGHMGLGLALALLLNSKLNQTVERVSRSLILLPWVISPSVVAILTQLWGHPLISPIAKILASFGWKGTFTPLGSVDYALLSIIIINVWQYTPYYMLMILANLQTLDNELIWAAEVDGANGIQKILYIVMPHIRDVMLTFTLYSLVVNAAYFDLIWIATQGGPIRVTEVLATYTYRLAFQSLNWNKASVVGIVLLALSAVLSVIVLSLMRSDK